MLFKNLNCLDATTDDCSSLLEYILLYMKFYYYSMMAEAVPNHEEYISNLYANFFHRIEDHSEINTPYNSLWGNISKLESIASNPRKLLSEITENLAMSSNETQVHFCLKRLQLSYEILLNLSELPPQFDLLFKDLREYINLKNQLEIWDPNTQQKYLVNKAIFNDFMRNICNLQDACNLLLKKFQFLIKDIELKNISHKRGPYKKTTANKQKVVSYFRQTLKDKIESVLKEVPKRAPIQTDILASSAKALENSHFGTGLETLRTYLRAEGTNRKKLYDEIYQQLCIELRLTNK